MNLRIMFSKISMMYQQLLKIIANGLDPLFSFHGKQTSSSRIVVVNLALGLHSSSMPMCCFFFFLERKAFSQSWVEQEREGKISRPARCLGTSTDLRSNGRDAGDSY